MWLRLRRDGEAAVSVKPPGPVPETPGEVSLQEGTRFFLRNMLSPPAAICTRTRRRSRESRLRSRAAHGLHELKTTLRTNQAWLEFRGNLGCGGGGSLDSTFQ